MARKTQKQLANILELSKEIKKHISTYIYVRIYVCMYMHKCCGFKDPDRPKVSAPKKRILREKVSFSAAAVNLGRKSRTRELF